MPSRAGRYQEAVETLTRREQLLRALAAELHPGVETTSSPGDLAFLAMAHLQLGQREKAREFLKMLRDRMKRDVISSSYRVVLAEA
jgi:hypothetical protein